MDQRKGDLVPINPQYVRVIMIHLLAILDVCSKSDFLIFKSVFVMFQYGPKVVDQPKTAIALGLKIPESQIPSAILIGKSLGTIKCEKMKMMMLLKKER